MRRSHLFLKTRKKAPKDETSRNAQLLLRGGFIDKLMAGSYTLLPLGWRVLNNINTIIREELNAIGAEEMLMPLMHPKDVWAATGRWESAQEVMFQLEKNEKEYALSFTHEEIVMDLMRKRNFSYKDLPTAVYHFSTKFRNEKRPRSGLLRGIEFIMNDLYSLHTSKEDMQSYYDTVKEAYIRIFNRCGLEVLVTEAPGGVFTDEHTHEFQVLAENGEDTIYYCESCDWARNKEIAQVADGDPCPGCKKGSVRKARSIEVGNIFPLGTWYAEKMDATFTTEDGEEKPFWFASYGIGTTRVIATLAEVFGDENGLAWPVSVAPYSVHLLNIATSGNGEADKVYAALQESGIEVLYDDREDASTGEKFAEADLIGIPFRLVVSDKTLAEESVELKPRMQDAEELIPIKEIEETVVERINRQ